MDQLFSPAPPEGDGQPAKAVSGRLAVSNAPQKSQEEAPLKKGTGNPAFAGQTPPSADTPQLEKARETTTPPKAAEKDAAPESISMVNSCLNLIARETGLDVDDFSDESTFVELGVDSLMSLVLSEKFRNELDLEIKSSLFLECTTIGDLKTWLEQYC